MFRNNLKTAFRALRKNRFISVVNIAALSLGITVCLLILMYIVNELSYESFQKNRKNIYRIIAEWGTEGNKMKFAGIMPAMAPVLDNSIPGIEAAVRLRRDYDAVIKTPRNEEIKEENFFFADEKFFQIFSFKLLEGDPSKALAEPMSMVISEKIARKYFSSSEALGQTLTYNGTPCKITGVMENAHENSHITSDFLLSYSTIKALGHAEEQPWNSWGQDLTYILLNKSTNSASVLPLVINLFKQNAGEWMSSRMKFELQPMSEIHWSGDARSDIGPKSNKIYIYIFLTAAIFVLVIACFNFLNLSISQYLGRMKEVGVRKTSGAQRMQLIKQFMTESGVVIVLSASLAIFLFEAFYLKLYSYLGALYVLDRSHFIILAAVVLSIIVLVGAFAGAYPAFYVSRFNPIEMLRNETSGDRNKLLFRKLLVMLQFFITVILIVGTLIIYRQLNYMKNSDLGFKKDDVALLYLPGGTKDAEQKYEVFKAELLKNSAITSVSGAFTVPGVNSMQTIGVRQSSAPAESTVNIEGVPADFDYVKAMGLAIADGRDFSEKFSNDKSESVLLNESAVRALGLKNPVGASLRIPAAENKEREVIVVGVVKDFHIQSFHYKISPMILYINPEMYICALARAVQGSRNQTADYIKSVWKSVYPDAVLNMNYLDDAYFKLYMSEEKSGQLLSVFTVLALLISCLGLFGFASFIVSKRIKEVGIRKVLGAKVPGIAFMLSGQFALWIGISGIIACPVAYMVCQKWLDSFAFKVNISWWIFAAAITFELLIALITVLFQTYKIATQNPVELLRYE
jgi:putative ABC transport system permease protein